MKLTPLTDLEVLWKHKIKTKTGILSPRVFAEGMLQIQGPTAVTEIKKVCMLNCIIFVKKMFRDANNLEKITQSYEL